VKRGLSRGRSGSAMSKEKGNVGSRYGKNGGVLGCEMVGCYVPDVSIRKRKKRGDTCMQERQTIRKADLGVEEKGKPAQFDTKVIRIQPRSNRRKKR